MFFYDGSRCPVCGRAFQENDDIVACPQCGAPHHRACWQAEGHCHYEEQHAAGFRWQREEPAEEDSAAESPASGPAPHTAPPEGGRPSPRCARCGYLNVPDAAFCSRCGAPLGTAPYGNPYAYGEYAPFHVTPMDPCGGVNPQEDLDGVTAEDVAACVRVNTAYYLPRFSRLHRSGGWVSWNTAAFLLGPYWLFFRKCYGAGGVMLALTAFCRCFFTAVYMATLLPILQASSSYVDASQTLAEALTNGTLSPLLVGLMYVFLFGLLLLHLICGLFGNRLYLSACLRRVRHLREGNPASYKVFLPTSGGASVFVATLSFFAVYTLQTLITYFFI